MFNVNFSIFKSRKPNLQVKQGDYVIWRKESAGRVYTVGGLVTGGTFYKGLFTWDVTPLVEYDHLCNQWIPSGFNHLKSMRVADDTVITHFQDALQAVS